MSGTASAPMAATSWPAGLIAFVIVLLLVPIIRIFCARFRLYDKPGPLKIHERPIPRLGGVAVVFAIVLGVALSRATPPHGIWFLGSALALVWMSGLIDDLRGLPPATRLAVQAIAALLVWQGGWGMYIFGSPEANIAATILYVVLYVNAFNFLDGSDGIAVGVTALIAIAYLLLPTGMLDTIGPASAWALLGASAGSLFANFPPAKIFLGDSGSSVLGFSVAMLGLELYRTSEPGKIPVFFPFLITSLAILDALLAVARRLLHGRSPLSGDRFHMYDLLRERGWSARRVALTCYGLTGALCATGLAIIQWGLVPQLMICLAISGGLVATGVRLGSLRGDETIRGEIEVSESWERETLWSEPAASAQRVRPKA